jgi:hypothetical protein
VILSGVLSEIALRGLEFRRRLPRGPTPGTPALVEIEVHNQKRYAPSYSIEVEDRIEGRRTDKRCYFLKVSAGARQTAAYRRVAPVRGRRALPLAAGGDALPLRALREVARGRHEEEQRGVPRRRCALAGRRRPTVAHRGRA